MKFISMFKITFEADNIIDANEQSLSAAKDLLNFSKILEKNLEYSVMPSPINNSEVTHK